MGWWSRGSWVLGWVMCGEGLEGNMSADSDELSCIEMVCNIFQSFIILKCRLHMTKKVI